MNNLQWLVAKLARIKLVKAPIQPVPVLTTALTLDQWRADKDLVAASRELALADTYKLQIQVLKNIAPENYGFTGRATIEDRAVQQAKIEGYHACLNALEAFTKGANSKEALETTYGAQDDK